MEPRAHGLDFLSSGRATLLNRRYCVIGGTPPRAINSDHSTIRSCARSRGTDSMQGGGYAGTFGNDRAAREGWLRRWLAALSPVSTKQLSPTQS